MSHNERTTPTLSVSAEQPTRQLPQQAMDDALSAIDRITRTGGDGGFLSPLNRTITKQRQRILTAHGEAAVRRLELDYAAHERGHKEWHERLLVHLRSELRAGEAEHLNRLLSRVYDDIRKTGQELAVKLSQGIEDATSIKNELARELRIADLENMMRAHAEHSERLRASFAASLEAQVQR